MSVVLFTQNASLSSFWQKHDIKDAAFAYSQNEFFKLLNQPNATIAAVDTGSMRGGAVNFITDILELFPNLKLLVLSSEPKFSEGKFLLTLGIKGYANSHMQSVHFIDALNAINDDNVWLYPEFIQQMIGELTSGKATIKPKSIALLDELSAREREIAMLVYKGMSNQEISEQTGITLRTVKAHATAIYSKLGVKDRVGLVLFMQEANG